ncbi:MAG: hypothetical protein OEY01_10655 [Desulfobulbaceae bacterium]|nr:hypothetical protein [Desulfobulbaceae bacterium]
MKQLIAAILLTVCWPQTAGALQVQLFGKSADEIFAQNPFYVAAGFAASLAVHEISHLIAFEAVGGDYEYNGGLAFHIDRTTETDREMRWIARSGMLGQLLVGSALRLLPATKDSAFTSGYSQMAALEILTYPIRRPTNGDLFTLGDNGGNKTGEYALYAVWAGGNLITVKW